MYNSQVLYICMGWKGAQLKHGKLDVHLQWQACCASRANTINSPSSFVSIQAEAYFNDWMEYNTDKEFDL